MKSVLWCNFLFLLCFLVVGLAACSPNMPATIEECEALYRHGEKIYATPEGRSAELKSIFGKMFVEKVDGKTYLVECQIKFVQYCKARLPGRHVRRCLETKDVHELEACFLED